MPRKAKPRPCVECGEQLKHYQKKYCCNPCYWSGRYGKEVEWCGTLVREGKPLQALQQMCSEDIAQKKVAEGVGISKDAVARLVAKHGKDVEFPVRHCEWCDKPIASNELRGSRKYCCEECAYKAGYIKRCGHEPEPQAVDLEARKTALELYRDGQGSVESAKQLKVPRKTVSSWIARHGREITRELYPNALEESELRRRLRKAQTAAKWVEILEASAGSLGESKGESIILDPIRVNGQSGWDYYAEVVIARMKMNPFSGERFAFCNLSRTAVTVIRWKNNTFLLTRARKASGTYLWPPEDFNDIFIVSGGAFLHLLSHQKTRRKPKIIV